MSHQEPLPHPHSLFHMWTSRTPGTRALGTITNTMHTAESFPSSSSLRACAIPGPIPWYRPGDGPGGVRCGVCQGASVHQDVILGGRGWVGIRSVVARPMGHMEGQARAMVERDGGTHDDGAAHSVAVAGSRGADARVADAVVDPVDPSRALHRTSSLIVAWPVPAVP